MNNRICVIFRLIGCKRAPTMLPVSVLAETRQIMTWIRIFSESDLEEFKEKYFAVSGFHVSVEDLQRYQVYVLKEGCSFRGGFWLIPSPPYRCLKTLPDEYLAADRAIAKAMAKPLIEMGGMWKEESMRRRASSAGFFLGTLFAIREMPPNAWVMFGYDHQQDYMRRFYHCCDAFVLYRGPIVRPGENHGEGIHATICAVP